ncbi:MAG: 3-phosphoglycerate dehydrogenase [Planctomycetota bacterium]|nr:MAG: 3-phosphoglycerate dehydrogenase [Planctomycetota bacterium]
MKKIKTYNTIATIGLEKFSRDHYEVASEIIRPDAIMLRSQNLYDEVIPESTLAIARAGAGTNNVPVEECSKKGIVVFNTPGANANAVKELVLSALLLSSRGIREGIEFAQNIASDMPASDLSKYIEAEKKRFKGCEIAGKTLGVMGLGAIGSMVANMALALGMKVVGYDPALSVEAAWRLSSKVEKMENLSSLLSQSDFVSLHVPAIVATHHLINKESLASAKQGLCLLNFAREEIVNTDAVIVALNSGLLSRYVTDFPTTNLLGRKDVILMPHIGASTREAEENCAVMAGEQLVAFLENGEISNSVNFPTAKMQRTTGYRITFCNENVSGVLGNVLSILATEKINVIVMLNNSRENVAYNILDLEQEPSVALIDKLRQVDNVINVRVL